ncbi:MAG: DJ-1/PfpI family protein [Prevotella sp.]|nr:DJ-1/PfpI family protein [Prevotella sp.]MCM1075646.1 DJ-1/PfpI family protein [Ruminococcus sp.]
MKTSYVFFADGFEDIEAITVVDVLRRAGMPVQTVSISSSLKVTSAHGVAMAADIMFDACSYKDADWLICPGGMPGASNLYEFDPLKGLLKKHAEEGGNLAAICAAPAVVFGQLGLLEGRDATCYPGFESLCKGAKMIDKPVVYSKNMVLGNGPANALLWALSIVKTAQGEQAMRKLANDMLLYPRTENDLDYVFG